MRLTVITLQVNCSGLLGTGAKDMRTELEHADLTVPFSRYPECHVSRDGEWVVLGGTPESVVPSDVLGRHEDSDPAPRRLKSSVGDALDHFLVLADIAFGHAEHLREHIATFGISHLCGDHGLPMFHTSPARSRDSATAGRTITRGVSCLTGGPADAEGVAGIRVDAAVAIARFFNAVLDLAYVVRHGKKVARWHLDDVAVPGREKSVTWQLAVSEFEAHEKPRTPRLRTLVTQGADGFLRQCTSQAGVAWLEHRRPELVMKAKDSWGLYTLEMIRRLSVDGERRETHRCVFCDDVVLMPRRPREGDRTVCDSPECRREKERRKKAAQRAKRRDAE